MATFLPLSDEEINNSRKKLMPGVYNFSVKDAKEKQSQAGNLCFELTLKVWDEVGSEFTVWDNLTFVQSAMWKLKSFCDAVGLQDKYMTGQLHVMDVISHSGIAKFGLKRDRNNEDRPFVMEYKDLKDKDSLTTLSQRAKKEKSEAGEEFNDDVPF